MAVYFDNAATSPPLHEAVSAMCETATRFGNPSSLHAMGLDAEHILSSARETIAVALAITGVSRTNPCIYFTSGGTEGNNLLLSGVMERYFYSLADKKSSVRVITTASEHSSVSAVFDNAERHGLEVVRIPCRGGVFDMERFCAAMTPQTVLVSVMAVGNETGAVYNTSAVFKAAREINPRVICHTDATQAFMKVPFTVKTAAADLITLSAHKIGAFKGAGAVYIDPKLITAKRVTPVFFGGGQEFAVRPGTENVPGIAAFAAAVKVRATAAEQNRMTAEAIRTHIIKGLPEKTHANLTPLYSPFILSLTAPGIRSEIMLQYLSAMDIFVSSGSACSSHSQKKASPALLDFGLSQKDADCTVRLSFGTQNTIADAEEFLRAYTSALSDIRHTS